MQSPSRIACGELAVPPAHRHGGICPLESGHLRSTGINASAHKQYCYHPAAPRCHVGPRVRGVLFPTRNHHPEHRRLQLQRMVALHSRHLALVRMISDCPRNPYSSAVDRLRQLHRPTRRRCFAGNAAILSWQSAPLIEAIVRVAWKKTSGANHFCLLRYGTDIPIMRCTAEPVRS